MAHQLAVVENFAGLLVHNGVRAMHIVLDSLHFFCNSLSFFCRGMSDGRRAATDWVRVAGGAACLCWDAVRDCVLAASAVVEVWIGCWRRRRLVVDGSLGTLGIGVGDSI